MIKRIISAIVLIPVVVAVAAYLPEAVLAAAVTAVTALSVSEFVGLSPTNRTTYKFKTITVMLGAAMPAAVFFFDAVILMPYLIFTAGVIFFLHMSKYAVDFTVASRDTVFDIAGMVYLPLTLSHFLLLRDISGGGLWIIFLFAVIWANDTCAYAVGKPFGRNKLCTNLSPGKSIEGAVAGIIGGAAAGAAFIAFAPPLGISVIHAAILSVFIGAISIIGDLAESLLKRGAGVKDSGSIIPGHGGILDRIDSLIFALPALYYYLMLTGMAQ